MPAELLWSIQGSDVTADGSSVPTDLSRVDSLWLAVTSVSMVLPDRARVSWSVYGKKPVTFGGTTISLYGR